MFYAHLALGKVLKVLVVKATGSAPPRIHDLKKLAGLTGFSLDQRAIEFLGIMNYYQVACRYIEARGHEIHASLALRHLQKAKELFEWLTR